MQQFKQPSRIYRLLSVMFITILLSAPAFGKPTMVWLRPVSFGVDVNGIDIVRGPEYNFMTYLSEQLPDYEHKFESYPIKRSWYLIQNQLSDDTVYCFYGASFKQSRTEWGYYSHPTTILLPYPIVARKNALDAFAHDGKVSIATLFAAGKKSILFDGVTNVWTEAAELAAPSENAILRLNLGHQDVAEVTVKFIANNRIDFAYVGSGQDEIQKLEDTLNVALSVYQVTELTNKVVRGNRLLCSKSPLGEKVIEQLNVTLLEILQDPARNRQFRNLNFALIGYHPQLRQAFNTHWPALLSE